ncbi:MAG: ribosome-binding factor A [Rickettsiales bacterium]|jgi:ribosome-binding factor A|nr:ribosome-binding factor A [Rickettsiales bacterium]
MMKKQTNSNRAEKIASTVQKYAAEILRDRGFAVTLSGAESHGGLAFVRLFWQGDRLSQPRLDSDKNAIRYELAQRMNQKYVPDIQFIYDDTLEKSEKIDQLLANLNS